MLIINVFVGNEAGFFIGKRLIKYLKTAPINPPIPTKMQFIIIAPSIL